MDDRHRGEDNLKREEVANLLKISEETIDYYGTEGLIPLRWREYKEEDILQIKKVIILRRLGIPVQQIYWLECCTWTLGRSLREAIEHLENSEENMDGALTVLKDMKEKQVEYADLDVNGYWNFICTEETIGKQFFRIERDGVCEPEEILEEIKGKIWINQIRKDYKEKGLLYVINGVVLLLVGCVGIRVLINKTSFWENLGMLVLEMLVTSGIIALFCWLYKKNARAAGVLANIILTICVVLFAGLALMIGVLLLNSWLHFWY